MYYLLKNTIVITKQLCLVSFLVKYRRFSFSESIELRCDFFNAHNFVTCISKARRSDQPHISCSDYSKFHNFFHLKLFFKIYYELYSLAWLVSIYKYVNKIHGIEIVWRMAILVYNSVSCEERVGFFTSLRMTWFQRAGKKHRT